MHRAALFATAYKYPNSVYETCGAERIAESVSGHSVCQQVIGEGFHPEAGKPHAEVYALRAAGQAAKGATAYVTLEPCNHYGRTPPCSRALVAAQVSRVCHSKVIPS